MVGCIDAVLITVEDLEVYDMYIDLKAGSKAEVTTGCKGFGASHRVKSSEQVEAGPHGDQGWENRLRRVKNLELCKRRPNKGYVVHRCLVKKMLGCRYLLLAVCLVVACKSGMFGSLLGVASFETIVT